MTWSLLDPIELSWRKKAAGLDVLADIILRIAPRGPQLSCRYKNLKGSQLRIEGQTICYVMMVNPVF